MSMQTWLGVLLLLLIFIAGGATGIILMADYSPPPISVTDTMRLPPDPGWIEGFHLNCVWVPEPTDEEEG